MPRTTVNVDDPVFRELKRMQTREKKSLGRLVSDLLAEAIAARRAGVVAEDASFEWVSRPMGARVDLADKEALYRALEEKPPGRKR